MASHEQATGEDTSSQIHPYDVLILKHYPDQDLPSLYENDSAYLTLYNFAIGREQRGIAPPRVPWPSPPPRSRDNLEVEIEEWRDKALRAIDSPRKNRVSSDTTHTTHRALLLTELLDSILQYTPPKTQFVARNVNTTWRQAIDYILEHSYRSPEPCMPVEYGDHINAQISVLQPLDRDLTEAEQQAPMLSHMSHPEAGRISYTALITQAQSISQSAYDAYQAMYERIWSIQRFPPVDGARRWVDLSQFNFNPYVLELLSGRVQLKFGRCEIALKVASGQPSMYRSPLAGANLHQLVGSMFLTQPPCKTLGIYIPTTGRASVDLVARISDPDGIKVGQFLDTLQQNTDHAVEFWKAQAETLRKEIQEPHWTEFSTAYQRKDIFGCYGYPKFFVFLEKTDDEVPRALAKQTHHQGEEFEVVCTNEWYEGTDK